MMKLGFIDFYLDEWHANNYPEMIRKASNGAMEVTCAFGLIDSPRGRTTEKWCADMGIRRAMTMEEVVEECDGIIVLSPDNCEMHEALCQIPLRSGKPTYIDKTFAPDLKTAKRIFDLAEKYHTPCYSSSALRFATEYEGIQDALAVSTWGPNDFDTYSIHQLEPVMMMISEKPEKVMYQQGEQWYSLQISFANGRKASLTGFAQGSPFMTNVVTREGSKCFEVTSDFFGGFIRQLVHFFENPAPIVPHEDTLRIMAVRTAGIKAQENPGQWVIV